jgi:hypothetical protein
VSSLTEQERRGLDDVFLSISTTENRLAKLNRIIPKYFKAVKWQKHSCKAPKQLVKLPIRIKLTNFVAMIYKNKKKKKNLS